MPYHLSCRVFWDRVLEDEDTDRSHLHSLVADANLSLGHSASTPVHVSATSQSPAAFLQSRRRGNSNGQHIKVFVGAVLSASWQVTASRPGISHSLEPGPKWATFTWQPCTRDQSRPAGLLATAKDGTFTMPLTYITWAVQCGRHSKVELLQLSDAKDCLTKTVDKCSQLASAPFSSYLRPFGLRSHLCGVSECLA
jgi:hypothetical protein